MTQRIVRGKFYLPNSEEFRYYRLLLAPSSIKGAGTGVYAIDSIPKGAMGVYTGAYKKTSKTVNSLYTWSLHEYDEDTGEVTDDDKVIGYIDCGAENQGNWTKYVNCGMREKDNNVTPLQIYNKMYYVMAKRIRGAKKGTKLTIPFDLKKLIELFIDYGEGYREEHLGINNDEY